MFGSQVLDVVVGLVFIYLLLSIICTAVNETIAALFSLRARNLAKGIANLLADKRVKGLAELFYEHPLIKSLYRGGKKPSYIPSRTFALAFLDGIAPVTAGGPDILPEIKSAVAGLPSDSELRRVLLLLLQDAGDDSKKFYANIETWFGDAMTRVSGWYKRKAQAVILILALLVTGLTNADTLEIISRLKTDSALRAAVVSQAQALAGKQTEAQSPQPGKVQEGENPVAATGDTAEAPPPAPSQTQEPKENIAQALQNLRYTGIPFGWHAMPAQDEWVNKIIGLLFTSFAVSLGSPFWFDILNRIAKIRATGAVPDAAAKDEKKDDPARRS